MNTATLPFTLLVGSLAVAGVALACLLPEALNLADARWTALGVATARGLTFIYRVVRLAAL